MEIFNIIYKVYIFSGFLSLCLFWYTISNYEFDDENLLTKFFANYESKILKIFFKEKFIRELKSKQIPFMGALIVIAVLLLPLFYPFAEIAYRLKIYYIRKNKTMYKDIRNILKKEFNYDIKIENPSKGDLSDPKTRKTMELVFLEKAKVFLYTHYGVHLVFNQVINAHNTSGLCTIDIVPRVLFNSKNRNFCKDLINFSDRVYQEAYNMSLNNKYMNAIANSYFFFEITKRPRGLEDSNDTKYFNSYEEALKHALYEVLSSYSMYITENLPF